MGNVFTKAVGQSLVQYDSALPYRWFDAVGPTAVKVLEEFQQTAFASANNMAACTTTLVNASTVALVAGANGGQVLISTAGAENDGANIQFLGEAFSFASPWEAYFGIRFKVSEATQSDFLVGLCITDTDLLGGMTDGIYFRKVDGSAAISFVLEKNSAETEVAAVHTCVADTFVDLEFIYDGANVDAYVNGAKKASIAAGNANFCNDEFLTPSVHFLTGAAAPITMTVDWLRAIQVQG